MNKFLIASVAILLVGCDPYTKPIAFPVLPPELKDCTFHVVDNKAYNLVVVRCPNSAVSTTYQTGKVRATIIVVDGVEYVRKDEEK